MADLETITETTADSLYKFHMKVQIWGSAILGIGGCAMGAYSISEMSSDNLGYIIVGIGALISTGMAVATTVGAVKMKRLYASDKDAYMEKYSKKTIVYDKAA